MAHEISQASSLTRIQRYTVAVAGVVLTAAFCLALREYLTEELSLFLFIIPISSAGWLGGLRPGLLATALVLVLAIFLFGTDNLAGRLMVALVGTTLSILFDRAAIDIAESRRAEEALHESEERYRLLTELSPDGVVIADDHGTIRLTNPSMSRMLGVPSERLIGQSLFDFIASEYWTHCKDCMKRLMTTDEVQTQVEVVFRSQDGRDIRAEITAIRFDWKGERFAQIVIHDLTARIHEEAEKNRLSAAIEAERDNLWRILEQMPVGIGIAEAPTGRIVFHNLEAERLLRHYLPKTGTYEDYGQFGALHEDGSPYRSEEYPAARALLFGEVIKGEEVRYRRGDGTLTFFSVDAAPVYDSEGHMVLAAAAFIDIAERKREREQLIESEERFAKAFQTSPNGLVISRIADGSILEVNESFVTMAGYSRHELIGKTSLALGLYYDPADRERALAILKEQGHVRDFEFPMQRRSGEVRLITFSAEPFDLRGEHCWLTIASDITERKHAEKERDRLLLQEKAAREAAEAANRMKDEFLATISHELRTPLTSILGWARILAGGRLSESQARHALLVIEQNAKSQARLVDDILDTSYIITGRLKLEARRVHIEPVFHAAIDVIRPTAEAKRIDLQVTIEERGATVWGDASRLQQVIWNLLSNAVKFTGAGGRVEARLTRSAGYIEISVHDTGVGVQPEFLPYVFDRFRQADSTSTRRFGGLGLGLAIVRHVVEMHGGTVSASSEGRGKGSTFTVRLPLVWSTEVPRPTPGWRKSG